MCVCIYNMFCYIILYCLILCFLEELFFSGSFWVFCADELHQAFFLPGIWKLQTVGKRKKLTRNLWLS